MIAEIIRACFSVAAKAVADRSEEINKLNVFPVPDGDTGTNMSLTLNTVVREVEELPAGATMADVAKAITHGSLMGARGNSGVITSQILRGLAEGLVDVREDLPSKKEVAGAWKRAEKVAFQAVRKPVEGTILTVLRDVANRAEKLAGNRKLELKDMLAELVVEAYDSVARTPDLLPVLKENGVVDSGAFGFAIFLEAFMKAALNDERPAIEFQATISSEDAAKAGVEDRVRIELNDDWEGSEFRYCTEFLFHSEVGALDEDEQLAFLASMGDCELLVGGPDDYKIHVHTNEPNVVLGHMLEIGQIFEVFIHNMELEAKERTAKIAADQKAEAEPAKPTKPLGFVAVASGRGQAEILRSLGVDVIVSGGQTMNPSTADILAAVQKVGAESVIVLPNNGNIRMAAEAAAGACDMCEVAVVPTKTVPQAFAAMFEADPEASLEENVDLMMDAIQGVRDGEVTTAVRDSSAADGTPIHAGDVMGISGGAIISVGSSVTDVTIDVINQMMDEEEGDTLTILAGADMDDEAFEALCEAIQEAQPDLEIDPQRGEQPLYPVIFSIE